MRKYKGTSDSIPKEWDRTSSSVYVYHNYNVVAVEETEATSYEFDVTEYTNKEYIELMDSEIKENTDAALELAELGTDNESRIAELEDAIMELAELIGG